MFAVLSTELQKAERSKEKSAQAELPQSKLFSSETLRRIRIALLAAQTRYHRANEHRLIRNEARVRKSDSAHPANTGFFRRSGRHSERSEEFLLGTPRMLDSWEVQDLFTT
jgi:hypothetical protein